MIIELKNRSAMASINTKGAELNSFCDTVGTEYIWNADPSYWGKSFPLLFPSVGILNNGKTIIDGKEYSIPKHGFARDKEFRLSYCDDTRAMFMLNYDQDTLQMYPYKFCLRVTYSLVDVNLSIKYEVLNLDDKIMYYGFGLHPAFKCPVSQPDKFSSYCIDFECEETLDSPLIDSNTGVLDIKNRVCLIENEKHLMLDYAMFEKDALVFEHIHSSQLKFHSILTGRGVELKFKGFDSLGLWTMADKQAPFFCIEPWCGMNDRTDENGIFKDKFGIKSIEPTASHEFELLICPL
ncbi:MAG: galactose mutarotase [Oscillospiraceae bacterium]|jgi:galactose mutarotase-like enzyme|nr:galactose mutarotase [Oscillospiraceae bacterium]